MAETINVNVADQGYPPPPPGNQALPENLGVLISGGLPVGGYVPIALPLEVVPAVDVDVAGQGGIAPLSTYGVGLLPVVDVIVDDQIVVGSSFPDEFIVTPTAGNFKTSVGLTPDKVTATILAVVDADTGGAVTALTVRYRITLSENLTQFGISFLGRILQVLTGSLANVGQVRNIGYWSVNTVYVNVIENGENFLFPTPLAAGNVIEIPIQRDSDEVVYDLRGVTVNASPAVPAPLPQDGVNVAIGNFRGDVNASSGVRGAFIGTGQQLPPFIGTFEVEDQPVLGGLPVNVFI